MPLKGVFFNLAPVTFQSEYNTSRYLANVPLLYLGSRIVNTKKNDICGET